MEERMFDESADAPFEFANIAIEDIPIIAVDATNGQITIDRFTSLRIPLNPYIGRFHFQAAAPAVATSRVPSESASRSHVLITLCRRLLTPMPHIPVTIDKPVTIHKVVKACFERTFLTTRNDSNDAHPVSPQSAKTGTEQILRVKYHQAHEF